MTTLDDRKPAVGTFRALSNRNFRLWLGGLLISGIGTWMQITAQDWTVLTELTDRDAKALAAVIALQTAPQLLLLPISGYVSDRYEKRRVLLVVQSVMAVIAVVLGLLVITGAVQYWHVCVLAGLLGAAQAFDAPARQTMVNVLVPPGQLANGIALGAATFNLARLIGPAVAGVLIVAVGAGWIFLANALTFLAMITALLLMRLDAQVRPIAPESRSAALLGGLRYVVQHREIRLLMILLFIVIGVVGSSINLLVITTSTTVFDSGSAGFGLLTSLIAVGSVLGALFVAARARPQASVLLGSVLVIGLALGTSAFMPTFVAFAIVMPFVGFGLMTGMATCNALIQTMTDPEVRGRVMGVYMAAWVSGATLGALGLGALIDWQGAPTALVVSGIACVVTGAIIAVGVRRVRNSDGERENVGRSATGDARGDLQ